MTTEATPLCNLYKSAPSSGSMQMCVWSFSRNSDLGSPLRSWKVGDHTSLERRIKHLTFGYIEVFQVHCGSSQPYRKKDSCHWKIKGMNCKMYYRCMCIYSTVLLNVRNDCADWHWKLWHPTKSHIKINCHLGLVAYSNKKFFWKPLVNSEYIYMYAWEREREPGEDYVRKKERREMKRGRRRGTGGRNMSQTSNMKKTYKCTNMISLDMHYRNIHVFAYLRGLL